MFKKLKRALKTGGAWIKELFGSGSLQSTNRSAQNSCNTLRECNVFTEEIEVEGAMKPRFEFVGENMTNLPEVENRG